MKKKKGIKCLFPNDCETKYKCCQICNKKDCLSRCLDSLKKCKYSYENTNKDYTECPRPKTTIPIIYSKGGKSK